MLERGNLNLLIAETSRWKNNFYSWFCIKAGFISI